MRKINLIAITTAAMSLALSGAALATTQNILLIGPAPVTWTSATSTLALGPSSATATPEDGQNGGASLSGQSVTFTSLVGSSFSNLPGQFTETLGGGSFSFGGLLSGTFTGATLTGTIGGDLGDVQYSGVVFTPGGAWLPAGFTNDALNTEFIDSSNFALTGGGTALADFTGGDGTTASGTPPPVTSSPEPASVATFGIGAMALMLMAAVARRRNAGAQL
jgi:hypothetical protein